MRELVNGGFAKARRGKPYEGPSPSQSYVNKMEDVLQGRIIGNSLDCYSSRCRSESYPCRK